MKKVDHLKEMMYFTTSDNLMNISSTSMANYLASTNGNESNYRSINENVSEIFKNNNNRWSHSVPQSMPWASAQSNFNQPLNNPSPSIIRFTAGPNIISEILSPDPCTSQTATEWELLNKLSSGTGTYPPHPHLKRKNSSDDEEDDESIRQPPTKQCISEDKFTDKFNEMSINSQRGNSSIFPRSSKIELVSSEFVEETMKEIDDEGEDIQEIEKPNKNPEFFLSKEVKQAMNSENFLDNLIREELNKTSKAIMLWQPSLISTLQKDQNEDQYFDNIDSSVDKSESDQMIVQ